MTKTLLITLTALLVVPSAASGATATADIERRQGTTFGVVTFTAAKGEVNDVTVTEPGGQLRFHDDRNRVRARGDCEQVNRNTALCPLTEDNARVKLGNRDDRARVEGLATILGGSGDDRLRGSGGTSSLEGERGRDTLRGAGGDDDLTGGPGRDRLFGGPGDDELIDGETDAQAASDLFRGGRSRDTAGPDRGDAIDYSKRRRALDINLARDRVNMSAERDIVRGAESVVGGSGDDRLSGDGDDNGLDGRGGDDRLRGRGGDDIPMGDGGNDRVDGNAGNDVVWGNGGTDRLSGGSGDDALIAADPNAEALTCGSGDDDVRTNRHDTLDECEVSNTGSIYVRVQPEISGDTATFQVACQRLNGCSGTLALLGPEGEDYGSADFAGLPDDPQTFSPVAVTLTQAGVDALVDGVVVQVTHGDTGGYRAFMRG